MAYLDKDTWADDKGYEDFEAYSQDNPVPTSSQWDRWYKTIRWNINRRIGTSVDLTTQDIVDWLEGVCIQAIDWKMEVHVAYSKNQPRPRGIPYDYISVENRKKLDGLDAQLMKGAIVA